MFSLFKYCLIYFNIDSYVLGVTGSAQSTLIYLGQDKSLNNIYFILFNYYSFPVSG